MTKLEERPDYYTYKLQCPKCNSKNCILYEEIIHIHITRCNKRTGWLRKKDEHLGRYDKVHYHYECEDCGYGHLGLDGNNDDFIIDTKGVYNE